MVQDGAGGGGAVAHGVVAEETDEHFVERGDYHFRRALLVRLYSLKTAVETSWA